MIGIPRGTRADYHQHSCVNTSQLHPNIPATSTIVFRNPALDFLHSFIYCFTTKIKNRALRSPRSPRSSLLSPLQFNHMNSEISYFNFLIPKNSKSCKAKIRKMLQILISAISIELKDTIYTFLVDSNFKLEDFLLSILFQKLFFNLFCTNF